MKIDSEKCDGCGICMEICPVSAIQMENKKATLNAELCVECGSCVNPCPKQAISE